MMENPFQFCLPFRRTKSESCLLSSELLASYREWANHVIAGAISPKEVGEKVLKLISAVEAYRIACIKETSGLVSVQDAAVMCGMTANALYIAFHRGRLPEGCFVPTGKKKGYKVNLALLYEYIQNNPVHVTR